MRLFYAIPLPEEIAAFQAELQRRAKGKGLAAKWPRPDDLHLTLAFLGEQPEERLPELMEIGRGATGPAFRLKTTGLGGFPRPSAARILWLGVEPEPAMDELCARLWKALLEARIPFDTKPFKPHITLARPKAPSDITPLGPAMEPLEMDVDRFVLYQSTTEKGGSRYEAIGTFPLG